MAKTKSELVVPQTKQLPVDYKERTVIDVETSDDHHFYKTTNGNAKNAKSAPDTVAIARSAFNTGKTKSVEFRRLQLKNLLRMFDENEKAMEDALEKDLHRPRQEASTCDIEVSKNVVRRTLMKLDEWTRPEYPQKRLINALDKVCIHNDPYGVVLIMSPWNFPINLLFIPLAGAIAAGNCVVVKPSEISEATEHLIAELIPKYLDKHCYQVFLGDGAETSELLKERFDYIFFSGSTKIGKLVHAAANTYLTPVTLELGGKSPVYIDDSVDIENSVKRILWGKVCNAGQICISPDYILCTKDVQESFVGIAKKILNEWYGKDVQSSPDYSRLISDKHFNRLVNLLKNKTIAVGGKSDASNRFIEPTILVDVNLNDPIMQEEIFGPILPIITIGSELEAIHFINAREKPLAIYVFTNKKNVKDLFVNNTSSGGLSINETLFHFTMDALPFGGVGYSGMGGYHGKYSFDTFVHKKGTLERDLGIISEKSFACRYPPYSEAKLNFINTMLRHRRGISRSCIKIFVIFCMGIIFTILVQIIYYCVTDKHLF